MSLNEKEWAISLLSVLLGDIQLRDSSLVEACEDTTVILMSVKASQINSNLIGLSLYRLTLKKT